jgi:hypothetical protein
MNKLKITGTHESYRILEFNEVEALYLEKLLEINFMTYDKIFFELKAYKKLGYKTLEDLPIVAQISGFQSKHPRTPSNPVDYYSYFHEQYPAGEFTHIKNNKKVFVSAVDRLEAKYHSALFKEFCDIKSTIRGDEVSFKKKRTCKYFFLKKIQSGTFSVAVKDTFQLNQLLFKHCVYHFKKVYHQPVQLLEIQRDDSKLEFTVGKKTLVEHFIISLNQ